MMRGQANLNPEEHMGQFMDNCAALDEDDEELAFKDCIGSNSGDPSKKAKTEAQFTDFMKFLAE